MKRLVIGAVLTGSGLAFGVPAPRGTLVLCGGGLDLGPESPVSAAMRTLAQTKLTHPGKPRLAAILSGSLSSASSRHAWIGAPDDIGYGDLFRAMGMDPTWVPAALDTYDGPSYLAGTKERAVARDPAWAKVVRESDIVFLNGGDQVRHIRVLLQDDGTDSPLLAAARDVLDRDGIVWGTSAGTHAQSELMFGGGVSYGYIEANRVHRLSLVEQVGKVLYERNHSHIGEGWIAGRDGYVQDPKTGERNPLRPTLTPPRDPEQILGSYGRGLNFFKGVLLDSHSGARGRLGRMLVTLATIRQAGNPPTHVAMGVDENTCLVWDRGTSSGQVVGTHGVWVIDASQAATSANGAAPFKASNVILSYVGAGDRLSLTADGRLGQVTSSKNLIGSRFIAPVAGAMDGDIFGKDRLLAALCRMAATGWTSLTAEAPGPTPDRKTFEVTFKTQEQTRFYGPAALTAATCSGSMLTVDRLRLTIN